MAQIHIPPAWGASRRRHSIIKCKYDIGMRARPLQNYILYEMADCVCTCATATADARILTNINEYFWCAPPRVCAMSSAHTYTHTRLGPANTERDRYPHAQHARTHIIRDTIKPSAPVCTARMCVGDVHAFHLHAHKLYNIIWE